MSGEKREQSGVSVKTLLIAAASSAIAAVVIPLLWRPGTVFAAAATPIIVALVSEALKRPVETVSAVRVRRTERGTAIFEPPPRPAEPEPFDPLAPPSAEDLERLPGAAAAPRRVERRRRLSGRQWKIGIATGLIAFLAAAAVVTASELAIFGDSVSSGRDRTTFFGGGSSSSGTSTKEEDAAKEEETPTPEATPTPTPEDETDPNATPTPDATPTPTLTPTPSVTATPPPADAPAPAPAPEATPVP